MITDVTSIRAIEAELRENIARTLTIIDNAGAVVFLKDAEGRYLLVNKCWEAATGIDRTKALGMRGDDLHPPHIARQLQLNDHEVMHLQKVLEREEVVERNGRRQVFLVAKSPLLDNAGKVYGLCGIATDITQRKEMEHSLKESARRLEITQRIAKIGNWELHIATDTFWWSEETFRLFGMNPVDQAPNRDTILSLIHPDDVERVKQAVATCIAQGSLYTIRCRITLSAGLMRMVEVHGELVVDDADNPSIVVGTIQDVSESQK